ncbi:hypothetical protein [Ralstonia mannitolilytica]|uniref:hypothetical protein n=1 Tax=Ralstonia mannitolilytica TaxID=105219 RepID=UPI001C937533|nr:hypothetical protein [Ralstonia mannitolilytica]MBY4717901.1 hypothetical protein [Ralstonia mannitolilytica]
MGFRARPETRVVLHTWWVFYMGYRFTTQQLPMTLRTRVIATLRATGRCPISKSFRCADAIVSARILREDSQEALSSSIAILRRPLQGLRTDCLLWTVTLVCRQVGFAKR